MGSDDNSSYRPGYQEVQDQYTVNNPWGRPIMPGGLTDDQKAAYKAAGYLDGSDLPDVPLIHNPGRVDLAWANPELYKQIEGLRGIEGAYSDLFKQVSDPGRYADLTREYQDRALTRTMNQFSNLGLGGSTAAIGAANEAGRQVDLSMRDRQINEMLRAGSAYGGVNNAITGDILKGQGIYDNYQQELANMYLQKQANDSNFWGSIIKGVATVGGAVAGGVLGGPAGAIAGAKGGSMLDVGGSDLALGVDGGLGGGGYDFGVGYSNLYAF